MAFVFRSDRGEVLTSKNPVPGPGTYIGPQEYRPPKSVAPFNSTAKRERDEKAEEQLPGPGSYNISIDLKNTGQNAKILVSSLNPEPIEVEKPKLSNVFKSTSKRFEDKQAKEELPGPGSYYKERGFAKQYQNPNAGVGSSRYQMIERAIKNTKFLSIPSIPSNVHSYGYSETENHDLLLNKNPLLEVQQFVGPGYYEVKDSFVAPGQKGVNWGKSAAKRFSQTTTGVKVPTSNNVGPGSYEINSKGTPLYKLKPSAGFASQSRRGFEERTKENSKAKRSSASAVESRLSGAIGFDEEEEDEYIEDATPGPGYYYNPSVTSSIKVQYKPAKLQFFGSGTERFKELSQNANYLGPGEYSMPGALARKKPNPNAPFQSSNIRFDKEKSGPQPGPGAYNPKINLVDQLVEKKKKGYVGHFGTTDKRFKGGQPVINTPGPGAYYQENDKDKVEDLTESANKGSHYFKSSTKREANTKKDEGPPPGAYDLKYYDLATKVIKEEEDPELSPKKAPFNSTDPRFREVKVPIPDDDDLPKPSTKNLDQLKKAKPSAAFASSVKRVDDPKSKEFIPGPGAYHDANDNSNWNKRTFNIHFTVD